MHFTFILNKRIQVPFQKYKTKFRRHFRNKWLISFDKKASNWLRENLSPYQFSTDSIPRFSSNKKARYLPANIIIFKKLHFQKIQVEFSKNSVFQRAVIIGLHDLEEKSEATFATSRAEHYCSTENSLIEKISR